jgi:hypothetical protein
MRQRPTIDKAFGGHCIYRSRHAAYESFQSCFSSRCRNAWFWSLSFGSFCRTPHAGAEGEEMNATDLRDHEKMAAKLEGTARRLSTAPGRDLLLQDIAIFRAQLTALQAAALRPSGEALNAKGKRVPPKPTDPTLDIRLRTLLSSWKHGDFALERIFIVSGQSLTRAKQSSTVSSRTVADPTRDGS